MIYLVNIVHESKRCGLNISRISQNAPTDAITKLNGFYRLQKDSVESSVAGPQVIATFGKWRYLENRMSRALKAA